MAAAPPSPKVLAVAPEWIERHCVIPDGFKLGRPFRLYDYQLQYLANFYRVRGDVIFDAAAPVLGPAFVNQLALLVGPQKVGKNPLIAAHICLEGTGPALFAGWAGADDGYACVDHGCGCGWEYAYDAGEPMGMHWPTPLIQITAFSEDSTDNTYDALRPMIELGRLADIIPKTGEEFIRLPGGGRIDVVTASAQSRLGQRVTFVPQDEVGIWTTENKMRKVADTQWRNLGGMGGRAALTTNAWDPSEHSVGQDVYESTAPDVYRQFLQPPKKLRHRYTDKAARQQIHRAVYPPDVLTENGGHIDLTGIESVAARLIVRDPNQAARFFGNITIAGAGRAVDPAAWDALARTREIERGTYLALGFDGSISDDATVLRACLPDGYSFIIKSWVREPGAPVDWRVPRTEVHEEVARCFDQYRVGRMFCDPPKWSTEIEGWARDYGAEVVLFFDTNQDRRMAPAVDRWLTAITLGTHTHDGDEVTTAHVTNAHKRKARIKADETDGRTLYTLTKGDDGAKFDAAVADVLAHEAAMTMPPPPEPPAPLEPLFALT